MKKIFIIIILLIGISAHAEDAPDDTSDGGFDSAVDTSNLNNSTDFNFNNDSTQFNWEYADQGVLKNEDVQGDIYDPKVDEQEAYGKSTGFTFEPVDTNANKSAFGKSTPKLSLTAIVNWLLGIVGRLIYLIIALALVSFLYGILKLSFIDGHKPEAREQARKFMFWGIVSLFVMVSVWGLVSIFKVTLFGNGPLIIPELKSTKP